MQLRYIFSLLGSVCALFLVLGESTLGSQRSQPFEESSCKNGMRYAKLAHDGKKLISAPDDSKELAIRPFLNEEKGQFVSFRLREGRSIYTHELFGWGPEILWAPDSKQFAVNQTIGGGGFGEHPYIFSIQSGRLRSLDISAPVRRAFGNPVQCEVPVEPNMAVIKWLDSNRVLVVAQVVPVSICKCSGTFKSYELSLSDLKILHSYSQMETKRLFAESLGCELLDADDACAMNWQR
jgi:hypothetical protein